MKKYFVLVLLISFLSVALYAQSKDELAIRSVMDEQVNAWNSGNIDAFMQTYWKSDSLFICWIEISNLRLAKYFGWL